MSQKWQLSFEACVVWVSFFYVTIRCSYLTGFHFPIATLMTRLQKRHQHMKWKLDDLTFHVHRNVEDFISNTYIHS